MEIHGVWRSADHIIPDGPYKCSGCGGAVILDASMIFDMVDKHFHCPYCGAVMSSDLDTTKTKILLPPHPLRRKSDEYIIRSIEIEAPPS